MALTIDPDVDAQLRKRSTMAMPGDSGAGGLSKLTRCPCNVLSVWYTVLRSPEIARAVHLAGKELATTHFRINDFAPGWVGLRISSSPYIVYNEFAHTQKVFKTELGISPRLLRAPYGLRWFGMRTIQRQLDLKAIMWSVTGRDWAFTRTRNCRESATGDQSGRYCVST